MKKGISSLCACWLFPVSGAPPWLSTKLAATNLPWSGIFSRMGASGEHEEALAYVKVIRGGRVYAYASNTDNRTGDSGFIPAMKR